MTPSKTLERLIGSGMSDREAARKVDLFSAAASTLDGLSDMGTDERLLLYVPGRIELLGKHTDYAGGASLVCGLERGLCIVAAPRGDDRLRVLDVEKGAICEIPIAADLEAGEGWERYPRAVVRRLARNFPGKLAGLDVAVAGDLPRAAGLSSSSSLVIGLAVPMIDRNGLRERPEYVAAIRGPLHLAAYLSCIENGLPFEGLEGDAGVGTLGGSQDHAAILGSSSGELGRYAYGPLRELEKIALPAGYRFALAVSGVGAEKAGASRSSYNRAAGAMSTMLRLWNRHKARDDGSPVEVADSAPHALVELRALLGDSEGTGYSTQELLDRLEHLFEERGRVRSAALAIHAGNLEGFGRIVDESQLDAERRLGNQVPETIHLARHARRLGAVAASAFGAGYGGSVWALVREERLPGMLEEWEAGYREAFPGRGDACLFFEGGAGPGMFQL